MRPNFQGWQTPEEFNDWERSLDERENRAVNFYEAQHLRKRPVKVSPWAFFWMLFLTGCVGLYLLHVLGVLP